MQTLKPPASLPDTQIRHFQPGSRLEMPSLKPLWESRELLYFFVLRELKVRYKQTIFGWSWAILQPLFTMIVFTLVFSIIARVPTGEIPYPVFMLTGLLLWQFFTAAFRRCSGSLVENGHLIRKVYFPRLVFPISGNISCLVDFIISLPLLVVVLAFYRVMPSPNLVWVPVFVLITMLTAFGFGLWLSALHVRFRDVGFMLPFLLQIWMYATPVAYPYELVPEWIRPLYNLNPMVGVIDGMRWALLGNSGRPPDVWLLYSSLVVIVALTGGLIFFRRMENEFADVV
ncbi:MAG: ABC transporter permease [Anaerolineae bacterium]|nr:ABC transporter permease [Anaerolineae bacterium]